jgi:predicted nuclease of predicted toxin-antitoxin system
MPRLLTDENFIRPIFLGLLREQATLEIVRVQDVDLTSAEDPEILAWAASEGRVLLTHDSNTMTGFAYERISAGEPMPGLIVVKATADIGLAIEDILMLVRTTPDRDWENRVYYVPV